MKRTILVGFVVCIVTATASAVTRLVPGEYSSIQAAIQSSSDGDTIVVSPGIYYETINFGGRDIVVTSTDPNDPKVVAYTIINADDDGSAVTFENGETEAAVLTGFTITGGVGTVNDELIGDQGIGALFWGAGIYCVHASPTITRNIIAGNDGPMNVNVATADQALLSYGGGISCFECSPVITHNIIRRNTAYVAAGILVYIGQPVISNNMIYDNTAAVGGGVILIGGTFCNNTVVANGSGLGGIESMAGNLYVITDPTLPAVRVFNNIICDASSGGGIYTEGTITPGVFAYNNVWHNLPGNYAMIEDPQQGTLIYDGQISQTGKMGNISADPEFLDSFGKDYHLTLDSPCVNAGDPAPDPATGETDIDGESRVYAYRIDIGADEYVGYVKPVAFAGPDQHVLTPLETVTLDGTQSYFYDPCGVTKYRWAQVEGELVVLDDPNSATPTFVPEAMGRYVFELIVADDRYTGQSDQVLVLVAENQGPVADAGMDRMWEAPGEVVLDGTGSYDPDVVDRLSYKWRQVEGPAVELHDADTANPSFFCDAEGQYAFELIVNDGFVDSAPSLSRHMTITVTKSLQNKPVGAAGATLAYQPDVSDGKAVYVTGTSVQQWQITCTDLNTGLTSTFSGGATNLMPRIDGDLVIWAGGASFDATGLRPECTSVFIRDVVTGTQQTLRARSNTVSYGRPAISGNRAVWVEHPAVDRNVPEQWYDMPYDICGADVSDLKAPIFFTIATAAGRCDPVPLDDIASPYGIVDIEGNIVVWEGQGDIFAADISDLDNIRTFTVCSHPARQYDPAISGRFVVWTDERNDRGDIYGADISDLNDVREFAVARRAGTQLQPAIDGSSIVYMDGEGYGSLRLACVTRNYGVLDTDLPVSSPGAMPTLDGTTLIWLQGATNWIQGFSLRFGYSVFDGSVQNVSTGRRYDYIQHAVSCASAGEEIVVPQGRYVEKIDFAGTAVTVRSADPADSAVVAGTVIQAWGDVVICVSQEDANSVLDGLTITGGAHGITCSSTTPTIRRCNITANRDSGVRLLYQSNPRIELCNIIGNGGAGIEMWSTGQGRTIKHNLAAVSNCIIAGNRREGIGGGKPAITNCTIVENLGDGLIVASSVVTNSIIRLNGRGGSGVQINSSYVTATYSDVEGGWPGDGNIDADPLFVEPGRWVSAVDGSILSDPTSTAAVWIAGDYHLKSQGRRWDGHSGAWVADAVTSPCIDAGDPTWPLLDESLDALYPNPAINMGAYGGTAQASLAPPGN